MNAARRRQPFTRTMRFSLPQRWSVPALITMLTAPSTAQIGCGGRIWTCGLQMMITQRATGLLQSALDMELTVVRRLTACKLFDEILWQVSAGQISSGTPFCRINAAFHLDTERRIYAAAKNSVVRPLLHHGAGTGVVAFNRELVRK